MLIIVQYIIQVIWGIYVDYIARYISDIYPCHVLFYYIMLCLRTFKNIQECLKTFKNVEMLLNVHKHS